VNEESKSKKVKGKRKGKRESKQSLLPFSFCLLPCYNAPLCGTGAAGNDRACGVNPSFARSKSGVRLWRRHASAPLRLKISKASSLKKAESPGFIATAILEAKN
jgi:hypothetical protein